MKRRANAEVEARVTLGTKGPWVPTGKGNVHELELRNPQGALRCFPRHIVQAYLRPLKPPRQYGPKPKGSILLPAADA